MARPTERRRSREAAALGARLHDLSAGLAVGIALLKGGMQEGGSDTYLARSIEIFDRSLQELRALSLTQDLPRVRPINLESALRAEARLAGVELTFERYGDLAWLHEGEVELIHLAGREAIRNVMRHSGSRQCHVMLDLAGCPVFFRVRDWGAGLGASEAGGGGLEKLRQLAKTIHWTLNVRSMPGLGTELLLVGRGCPADDSAGRRLAELRSVVADQSLGSRRRVAPPRPIRGRGQQIS